MAFRKLLVLVMAAWIAHLARPGACLSQPAPAGDAAPAPFTVLFDTGAISAAPIAADALNAKKGWTAVPEDNLTHGFAGDAVFMNDRAAIVLRPGSAGAEFYSRSPGGWTQRAALLPLAADGAAGVLSSIKTIENSQAAVMIEVVLKPQSGPTATLRFRLSAGEALLDVRGGLGAGRLRVCDQAKYLVVPDFFADDMVFDPAEVEGSRIGLPAENSVLGLADDGKAIVACVWPSTRQNADLFLAGDRASRKIAGYEIDLADGNRLWIAVMEGAGIWHARRVTDQAGGSEVGLQWQPPMPARWRADFVAARGVAVSSSFAGAEKPGEADAGEGGAAGEERRNDGRCRFDSGRAIVRLRRTDSEAAMPDRLVVVYPIERTRATPLTAFCLVDIMRNALGVGPCQYVLDTERLGAADNPTPEPVTHWVEKEFAKKPSKRDADAIREQLAKMALQVKRTDERIGDYVSFGWKVTHACADYAKSSNKAAATTGRFLGISERMMPAERMTPAPAPAGPVVEKLAADVAAQAEQADALAKTKTSIAAIRAAGAAQDYALARLRMAARRLKQESRTLAVVDPKAAAFAGEIQQMAEQMLVKK